MEKNQQQEENPGMQQPPASDAGKHPGQQLPAGGAKEKLNASQTSGDNIRHSESSFPKNDNETLGTP